jgi:hypothetical protein
MHRTVTVALLAAAVALAFPAAPASAVDFGLRAGVYDDAGEAFVGGELLFQLSPRWYFNPNLEYVFVDNGDLVTINGDVHYDFPVDFNGYVWAGGGLALISDDREFPRRRRDDDDTDVGANLLAGVGWRANGMVPYLQGKLILADETEAVFGFGLRF